MPSPSGSLDACTSHLRRVGGGGGWAGAGGRGRRRGERRRGVGAHPNQTASPSRTEAAVHCSIWSAGTLTKVNWRSAWRAPLRRHPQVRLVARVVDEVDLPFGAVPLAHELGREALRRQRGPRPRHAARLADRPGERLRRRAEVDGEQLVRLGEPRALELVEGGRRRAGGVGAADGDGGGAEERREQRGHLRRRDRREGLGHRRPRHRPVLGEERGEVGPRAALLHRRLHHPVHVGVVVAAPRRVDRGGEEGVRPLEQMVEPQVDVGEVDAAAERVVRPPLRVRAERALRRVPDRVVRREEPAAPGGALVARQLLVLHGEAVGDAARRPREARVHRHVGERHRRQRALHAPVVRARGVLGGVRREPGAVELEVRGHARRRRPCARACRAARTCSPRRGSAGSSRPSRRPRAAGRSGSTTGSRRAAATATCSCRAS